MSDDFMPDNNGSSNSEYTGEQRNYPVPKAGSRRARVSLIVDLGVQDREDSYKTPAGVLCNSDTPDAIGTPQKPVRQVAIFADLVNDTVDYGGDIGKAHYRLMLNGTFNRVIKGINFNKSPPMDAKGKKIEGKEWTLHAQNLITKLAKAVGKDEVIESAKVNQLLDLPFMAEVAVNEKDSGKVDKDGEPIIYKNVNFKGSSKVSPVPTGEDDENGDPIEEIPKFNALKVPALCITFGNAQKDNIKYIRPAIIKMIKLANDYAGSNMEKAIQAYEADNAKSGDKPEEDDAPVAKVVKPVVKAKPMPKEDLDSDSSPF